MTVPAWLSGLVERASNPTRVRPWQRELPPTGQPGHRQSAVLLLFSPTDSATPGSPAAAGKTSLSADGPDPLVLQDVSIVLTERAHTLRSHPGQVSFPGGRAEPTDRDLAATALRETHEEVGVEPGTVEIAGVLPALNLSVSSHDVSPVLGWWPHPSRIWAREPAEVASVLQVPIADLVDPGNRFRVETPNGWVGPAFDAQGLLVWGFTAMVLSDILHVAGWELPWDTSDVRPLPPPYGSTRPARGVR
ncbi:NUDIX hydrolase [Ornithinimicrobium murale]|uniref:NUDIX hydrolase n=1 Tax=Ornithinimicrobium murale TaxID=1050153 RepID=UPI0013B3FB94|nr:CoA pyrophosphatase [Ornithinimicrobium murale]